MLFGTSQLTLQQLCSRPHQLVSYHTALLHEILADHTSVATIGLSLTIPLTLFCSFFIPSAAGTAITFLTLAGAIMVCGAIGILGWEGWKDSKLLPPGDERPATEDA